ncbi:hypothetical protein NITHO_1500004 [Nitrolancea hollandica Lb]|uniref:Uncharacterized protein n=1 Tax=Nitrolancea hollandica Lb TaxID=1129897 RepID=I4EDH3_9BACT|nr:hypothetical protein NITHO_1500004 [Nitrolancea hollandica Lb]
MTTPVGQWLGAGGLAAKPPRMVDGAGRREWTSSVVAPHTG